MAIFHAERKYWSVSTIRKQKQRREGESRAKVTWKMKVIREEILQGNHGAFITSNRIKGGNLLLQIIFNRSHLWKENLKQIWDDGRLRWFRWKPCKLIYRKRTNFREIFGFWLQSQFFFIIICLRNFLERCLSFLQRSKWIITNNKMIHEKAFSQSEPRKFKLLFIL